MANAMVSKGDEYENSIVKSIATNLSAVYYMIRPAKAKKRAHLSFANPSIE